eukprot:GHVR01024148.1.p1 GENE.GHVR01024148.1~~GHVR01024148.1.p1  ORF type:complete len:334 (-),score=73.40 GHVR01024148.1:214-1215(-)
MGTQQSNEVSYDNGGPTKSTFKNKKGLELVTWTWSPNDKPRAVIIGLHGVGGHSQAEFLKYPKLSYEGSWADKLKRHGIRLVALDQQSHGYSQGWCNKRCAIERFDDFVDDAEQLLVNLRESLDGEGNKDVAIIVCGISMGGAVACLLALRTPKQLNSVIMISPMLSLEKIKRSCVNRMLLPIAEVVSRASPNLPVASAEPNVMHPEIDAVLQADPLVYSSKVRARMANEMLIAVSKIQSEAPHMRIPFMIAHSKKDGMCEHEGSQTFFDSSTGIVDKELNLLDEGWHMIHVEPGHENVFNLTIRWIDRHALVPTGDPMITHTHTHTHTHIHT